MSNKEKCIWLLGAALLVLLFLMSSTDLIIKEKEIVIRPVPIILDDSSDAYYANFRKGADKAAEEFYADVSFITLYSSGSRSEQLELVRRELRDGAAAIVLAPVDGGETLMELEAMKPAVPFVVVGTEAAADFVAASVSSSRYQAGRLLGEAIARKTERSVPVYVFCEGLEQTGRSEAYSGLCEALEAAGLHWKLFERRTDDTYREAIESTVYPGEGRITVAALDAGALSEAAQIFDASSVYLGNKEGLYGIGSTTAILSAMERGTIDGIVAWNEFDAGYLSVKAAVEAAQGGWQPQQVQLPVYYLESEDLESTKYEKMLYPIE